MIFFTRSPPVRFSVPAPEARGVGAGRRTGGPGGPRGGGSPAQPHQAAAAGAGPPPRGLGKNQGRLGKNRTGSSEVGQRS